MFLSPKNNYKYKSKPPNHQKIYKNQLKKTDFFSLNEVQISQRIMQIPNYSRHFNPIIKDSFVKLAEIDDDNFERCTSISDENTHILLTQRNNKNSETFYDIFYNNQNNQNSQNSQKILLLNVINSYKHLLTAIKSLENAHIVNLNFHPTTLTFTNNLPIISNFSLCFHSKTMNEERKSNIFAVYNPKNVFLSLEAHVICFLNKTNAASLSFSNIEEIAADCQKRASSLSCFSKAFIEQYKAAAIFSLQPFINKPKTTIINEILQESCTTWNNYGLSILFLVLLRDIFKKDGKGIKNTPFISGFFQLLTQNIHPEPSKRTSILQNISLFNDILYNTSITEYDLILNQIFNQLNI